MERPASLSTAVSSASRAAAIQVCVGVSGFAACVCFYHPENPFFFGLSDVFCLKVHFVSIAVATGVPR